MNTMHEANRRYWNGVADWWERLEDEDGLWQRCPSEPELAFAGSALGMVREVAGSMTGKDVCVVGSGNNHAAFAFSGMGANVTSVDISERRLAVASKRARHLGLPITFVQADAADLSPIENAEFDVVFSSNGFFVWIADLQAVFTEIYRILRPGGHYVFYDIHPFQRPWKDQTKPMEVAKPYWETGPFEDEEEGSIGFNWTLADILNPLTTSGLILRRILESPAKDSRFWQDYSDLPGTDDTLLGWKENPRAALPVWLTAALWRPAHTEGNLAASYGVMESGEGHGQSTA